MAKTCSRCNRRRLDKSFRQRYQKRKGKVYLYLNNTCKKCESDVQKTRYHQQNNDEEFQIKNRERVNKYRLEYPDKVKEIAKKKRATARYKKNRKKYNLKNKEKLSAQEKICKKRYAEKNRDSLSDVYIGNILVQKTELKREEIPAELIELKRLLILSKRALKNKKHESRTTSQPDV